MDDDISCVPYKREGGCSIFGSAGARTEMPGCSLCMGNQARVNDMEYMAKVNPMADEIYRYLNFDQIGEFKEAAGKVIPIAAV